MDHHHDCGDHGAIYFPEPWIFISRTSHVSDYIHGFDHPVVCIWRRTGAGRLTAIEC